MIHRVYGKSGLQNHIVAPWYRISAPETNLLAEHIGLWVILAPKACANTCSPHSTPSSQSGSAAAKWAAPSNNRLQYMCYLTMAWCLLPFPFISHTHTHTRPKTIAHGWHPARGLLPPHKYIIKTNTKRLNDLLCRTSPGYCFHLRVENNNLW